MAKSSSTAFLSFAASILSMSFIILLLTKDVTKSLLLHAIAFAHPLDSLVEGYQTALRSVAQPGLRRGIESSLSLALSHPISTAPRILVRVHYLVDASSSYATEHDHIEEICDMLRQYCIDPMNRITSATIRCYQRHLPNDIGNLTIESLVLNTSFYIPSSSSSSSSLLLEQASTHRMDIVILAKSMTESGTSEHNPTTVELLRADLLHPHQGMVISSPNAADLKTEASAYTHTLCQYLRQNHLIAEDSYVDIASRDHRHCFADDELVSLQIMRFNAFLLKSYSILRELMVDLHEYTVPYSLLYDYYLLRLRLRGILYQMTGSPSIGTVYNDAMELFKKVTELSKHESLISRSRYPFEQLLAIYGPYWLPLTVPFIKGMLAMIKSSRRQPA
jgi:hypothetical protein